MNNTEGNSGISSLGAEVATKLRDYFEGKPEIAAAFLFGSVARGEQRAASDIDLAILLCSNGKTVSVNRSALVTDLMRRCKSPRVDVAVLNDASPLLQRRA